MESWQITPSEHWKPCGMGIINIWEAQQKKKSGVNNGVCAFGYKNGFTTLLSTKNPESHVVGFTDSPLSFRKQSSL